MKCKGTLAVGLLMFLCGCEPKTSTDADVGKTSASIDPSLYTIEAILLYGSDIPPNLPLPYSGSWVGGGGTFENSSGTGVRYRIALTPANRNHDQQFTLTTGGKTATSSVLNFRDCDFTSDSGYDPADFHKMTVYFFLDSKNSLVRTGFSSLERDATAVACEKVEVKSDARVLYASVTSDLKIQSQDKILVPERILKDQDSTSQIFTFHPTLTSRQDINVLSKAGTFPYQVSLKYCVDYFTKIGVDANTIGSEYLELSVDNSLIDRGYSCCGADGACTPRTAE